MSSTIQNAIISSARIGIERGFILDSWVHLDYSGAGQGFGGYALGGTAGTGVGDHTGPNYAAEWIIGVLRAADVEDWSKLTGKAVRVRIEGGLVKAIGHIIKDDLWFEPGAAFEMLRGAARARRSEQEGE